MSMWHRARKERSNSQRPLCFFLFRKVNLWHVAQYFKSRGIQLFNCAQRGQETQGQQLVQPLLLQTPWWPLLDMWSRRNRGQQAGIGCHE